MSALWEFLIFEICSQWRKAEGFQFLVSELTLLPFGGNSWPCFNVIVWYLLLRSGLNFSVLHASTEFTHSFAFGFLISFLMWNLVSSEVFIFLFLIFCIFVSFWCDIHFACGSDAQLVCVRLFFALCNKLLVWRCFDNLFRFDCLFQIIVFFAKVILVPHDELDPTLSRDNTFIWIFELP